MRRFTEDVDSPIREQLEIALQGRGAFGRFRHALRRHPDLQTRYFDMQHAELVGEAERWLRALGIEPLYELRPPLQTPEKAPGTTRDRSRIDLVDVLLLGAPSGKTECSEAAYGGNTTPKRPATPERCSRLSRAT